MTRSDIFHVGLVFDRSDPKAEKISTPFFADFVRLDGVAERFGHRTALFIERPAMRDDAFIRRAILYTDGKRGANCGTSRGTDRDLRDKHRQPFITVENGKIGRAGIEPDVGMSFSLRHFDWPQEHFVPGGRSSSAECLYQASAPSFLNHSMTLRSALKSSRRLPQPSQ